MEYVLLNNGVLKNNHERKRRVLDDAEEIDVRVVHGEVEYDGSGASVDPEVLLQVRDERLRLGLGRWQQNVVAARLVLLVQTVRTDSRVCLRRFVIHPTRYIIAENQR